MQYKPFPPEKRAYILQKPFEEFIQFFQEVPLNKRNRLVSILPPIKKGSFRRERPELLKMQLQELRRTTKNPKNSDNKPARDFLEAVWQAWIASHPELHALLEHYDNSDDFQDDEPKPPNTNLDIECFKYLTYASLNDKLNKEIIKKFYEFGYFKKEKIIDSYIEIAKNSKEVENTKKIFTIFEIFEKVKNDIVDLYQKNTEVINIYKSINNRIDVFESAISKQKK